MRKLPTPPNVDVGPVKLYLDDLSEILYALQELPPEGDITIHVGAYELQSLSELPQLPFKTAHSTSFTYTRFSPYLTVTVDVQMYRGASVRSSEDSTVVRGVVARIEQLFKRRLRGLQWTKRLNTIGTATAIAILALMVGLSIAFPTTIPPRYILYSLPFTVSLQFICMGIAMATLSIRRSEIRLIPIQEETSFWSRKKDDILLALIGAGVGLLLGIVGTLLTQALTP